MAPKRELVGEKKERKGKAIIERGTWNNIGSIGPIPPKKRNNLDVSRRSMHHIVQASHEYSDSDELARVGSNRILRFF